MSETYSDLYEDAQKAILRVVIERAPKTTGTKDILRLAEAFAWASSPSQAHGSSGGGE